MRPSPSPPTPLPRSTGGEGSKKSRHAEACRHHAPGKPAWLHSRLLAIVPRPWNKRVEGPARVGSRQVAPAPRRPRVAPLRSAPLASDAHPLFRPFRPADREPTGQAVPRAVVAGNGRGAALVPVQLRRHAVRPRRQGRGVLSAASAALPVARGIARRGVELAGARSR